MKIKSKMYLLLSVISSLVAIWFFLPVFFLVLLTVVNVISEQVANYMYNLISTMYGTPEWPLYLLLLIFFPIPMGMAAVFFRLWLKYKNL
jgi:hypothetical protein